MRLSCLLLLVLVILLMYKSYTKETKYSKMLNEATNIGILTWQGQKYHVIPWEGNTP